jgi:hypothetical protein
MDVTLLGPQRKTAAVRAAVAELMPHGPVATVNAGWREREADSGKLNEVLGGRMANLELYRRWIELTDTDAEYAAAERRLEQVLTEQQAVYAVRLQHAMAAVEAVSRRDSVPEVRELALADAVEAVWSLDEWQLRTVAAARADFSAAVDLGQRENLGRHRAEVAATIGDSAGLVITGGHVGVLLHLSHVFGLSQMITTPVVAWSGGAMVLSDRVVLFAEQGPLRHRHPEVYAEGLGAYAGVLPFPHARHRLRLDDAEHLGLLARRFAPRTCVLLGDGERVDLRDSMPLPDAARILSGTGVRRVGDEQRTSA